MLTVVLRTAFLLVIVAVAAIEAFVPDSLITTRGS